MKRASLKSLSKTLTQKTLPQKTPTEELRQERHKTLKEFCEKKDLPIPNQQGIEQYLKPIETPIEENIQQEPENQEQTTKKAKVETIEVSSSSSSSSESQSSEEEKSSEEKSPQVDEEPHFTINEKDIETILLVGQNYHDNKIDEKEYKECTLELINRLVDETPQPKKKKKTLKQGRKKQLPVIKRTKGDDGQILLERSNANDKKVLIKLSSEYLRTFSLKEAKCDKCFKDIKEEREKTPDDELAVVVCKAGKAIPVRHWFFCKGCCKKIGKEFDTETETQTGNPLQYFPHQNVKGKSADHYGVPKMDNSCCVILFEGKELIDRVLQYFTDMREEKRGCNPPYSMPAYIYCPHASVRSVIIEPKAICDAMSGKKFKDKFKDIDEFLDSDGGVEKFLTKHSKMNDEEIKKFVCIIDTTSVKGY